MAAVSLNPSRRTFISWSTQATGARLVGRFEGLHEGKFGPLADLDTAEGPVTVPATAVLVRQLSQVALGAAVTLVHRGLRPSQKGDRQYRDFEVLVEAADRIPERPEPEPEAPAEAEAVGAENVPF